MTELDYLEGIYDSVTSIEDFLMGEFIDVWFDPFYTLIADHFVWFLACFAILIGILVLRHIARW